MSYIFIQQTLISDPMVCVCVCCRHWQQLSEELGMNIQPKPTFTFSKCLEMGLDSHVEAIAKVADIAGKEFSIEQVQLHFFILYTALTQTYICSFKP